MSYVRLFVSLKITDNTARSAMYTLQNRLGFSALSGLSRCDFWELAFPGLSSQQALQTTERLVQKTALFVNPNKHRWHMEAADSSLQENPVVTLPESVSASVLVSDRIDGKAESVLEACEAHTQGAERPVALRRGVWWDLTFSGLDGEALRQAVEHSAVTTSRTEGILANPHYQDCQIFYP